MNTDIAAYFKFDLNSKKYSNLKSPFEDSKHLQTDFS